MRVLGIDEAGRGCVMGSLIVAGFIIDDVEELTLRQAGATDSKKLSHKKRIEVRSRLVDLGQADVRAITAVQIDGGNLNDLEETVIADLVNKWNPDVVFVDALGPPKAVPKVIARLSTMSGRDCAWTMEPKADLTFAVVGAASIFAKTHRDQLLEELRDEFGILGSGYPSDPKTRDWITAWAKTRRPWPSFVRTRWSTIETLSQQALF
jgi:ribonuclease HII